jgi:hypothetical protein
MHQDPYSYRFSVQHRVKPLSTCNGWWDGRVGGLADFVVQVAAGEYSIEEISEKSDDLAAATYAVDRS